MKDLGSIIAQRRKALGISQEELAEKTSLSLRTIQRIESGSSDPHGDTLRRICEVLKLDIEDLYEYSKVENSQYLVLMYLSILLFIVIPLGNLILPLILWVVKKNKIAGVNKHGVGILNFQLTWSLIFYSPAIYFILNRFFHLNIAFSDKIGPWQIIVFDLLIMSIINFAYIVFGAIMAKRGKVIRVAAIPFIK